MKNTFKFNKLYIFLNFIFYKNSCYTKLQICAVDWGAFLFIFLLKNQSNPPEKHFINENAWRQNIFTKKHSCKLIQTPPNKLLYYYFLIFLR